MRPPRRVPPDVWAAENRVYPKTAGVPGPRNPHLTPYGVPFSRAIHSGAYRRVVAVMASQMAKTEALLDSVGARLDQRPSPILYVGPSKDFVSTQFEPRLTEMFDQAASLAIKINRRQKSSKTLKRVAGVRIRLAHAGSSTALKSDPAALALVDEYDEMLANIRGQGDPLGLVEARGETYAEFVTAVTSTPSLGLVETYVDPASGLERWKPVEDLDDLPSAIWRLWQDGTRHEWTWKCPHCAEWFIPRFRHLRWAEGANDAEARRTAFLCCPANGCVIEDDGSPDGLKARMNAEGRLTAPGQWIDADGEIQGEPPDVATWSMWVSGLASPFQTFGQRAEAYVKALTSAEPDKIQTAINARFGECYSSAQGGAIADWQAIRQAAQPYRFGEVPREVLRLVAGVDVQKRSLYYIVRGFGSRGQSWLLERGQLLGDTAGDDVWDQLVERLSTPFAGLVVERAFVDAGFRPDKKEAGESHRVYQFCIEHPWIAQPTKGKDRASAPLVTGLVEVTARGSKDRRKLQIVHVHTDYFKSMVFAGIGQQAGRPNAWFVPEDVDEAYCRQVASEVRTVSKGGKPVWVRRSRDNHYLDCEALAWAAAYNLGLHRLPEGIMRHEDPVGDEPRPAVPADPADHDVSGPAASQPAASRPAASPASALPRDAAPAPRGPSMADRMAARAAAINARKG